MLQALQSDEPRSFELRLAEQGIHELRARDIDTLQVNLGKKCNQACHHCHVDAGPTRTEAMALETVELVLDVVRRHSIETLDVTGGAPELNPHFRYLAKTAAQMGKRVIDRSNLTVFFEPGYEDLPDFLAQHRIGVTASLPCYLEENVDRQRGLGVFQKSIEALKRLNELGYGRGDRGLALDLIYNSVGPFLPPPQTNLEADYERELQQRFGIVFDRLLTMTNMPITRFRRELQRTGQLEPYLDKLEKAFNPDTVGGLMCRHLISVRWDGWLYDCDFNQMLEIPVNEDAPGHIRDFDLFLLSRRAIQTGRHCFGCTAGAGSSCGGAVVT